MGEEPFVHVRREPPHQRESRRGERDHGSDDEQRTPPLDGHVSRASR